jgi:hypothetical protein
VDSGVKMEMVDLSSTKVPLVDLSSTKQQLIDLTNTDQQVDQKTVIKVHEYTEASKAPASCLLCKRKRHSMSEEEVLVLTNMTKAVNNVTVTPIFPKKTKCLTICMPGSSFMHIVTYM